MTFYLIGLGMNENSITTEAINKIKKCEEIFIEEYTVDFPYDKKVLENLFKREIKTLSRENVENESILNNSIQKNIGLLVYGDALSATTHTQLILTCIKQGIPYKILHNTSILITIAQTGLQLYKFGKTTSIPKWENSYKPTSFLEYYIENQKIKAHTLFLIDIGLDFTKALDQLECACREKEIHIEKIIVISKSGLDNQKIYYEDIDSLKNLEIEKPYCIIIPGDMHFIEEEFLNSIRIKLN